MLILMLLAPFSVSAAPNLPSEKIYTVNASGQEHDYNPGDGVCRISPTGPCTFVAALDEANNDSVPTTIRFATTVSISGISLEITEDGTTIDASDVFDVGTGYPRVTLYQGDTGYMMRIYASNTRIYGIFFHNPGGDYAGLYISGSNNIIGSTETGKRNVFAIGHPHNSILIQSGTANQIIGNYFGTVDGITKYGLGEQMGSAIFFQSGAWSGSAGNNIIINHEYAVRINGGGYHQIFGNTIGLDKDWTDPLPNGFGIQINNSIGNTIGPANMISASTANGIEIYRSSNTQITQNFIGTHEGNKRHGISVSGVSENATISQNRIENNSEDGIFIDGSSGATICMNIIINNSLNGIHVHNSVGGTIGGTVGKGNIISLNGNGIRLEGVSNFFVAGNFFGFSEFGPSNWGNTGFGILIENTDLPKPTGSINNEINYNWINHNILGGVMIRGNLTHDNKIYNNLFGVQENLAVPAGNGRHGVGIYSGAFGNTLAGNTIFASGWSGIGIHMANENIIFGNHIGVSENGLQFGNQYHGIHINQGANNRIEANEIAYNGHPGLDLPAGVMVQGTTATGNRITQNSIHDNNGMGIRLQDGGNGEILAPEITVVGPNCQGGVVIYHPFPTCTIEIFSDQGVEGRTYEGTAFPIGNGLYHWSGIPSGPNITATARDAYGNTSMFSSPYFSGICLKNTYLPLVSR